MFLALPARKDATELLALTRRSRDFHRGFSAPPTTPAAFASWLHSSRTPRQIELLLRRLDDDAIVGSVQLSQIIRGRFHSAYLGYWIGAPFARHGYMTDGLDLTLRYAFGTLHLHRIEANLQPDNHASRRLVQRLGFQQEGYSRRYLKIGGRWRDHERWAILAEDWRAARRQRQTR